MKSINEILENSQIHNKNLITSITAISAGQQTDTEKVANYINRIFDRMTVICPAWKQSCDGDATLWAGRYKQELVKALKNAGVSTSEEIKAGVQTLRAEGKAFMPAPGQFAKYCLGTTGGKGLHRTAAYRPYFKELSKNPAKRETVIRAFSAMKQKLSERRPAESSGRRQK